MSASTDHAATTLAAPSPSLRAFILRSIDRQQPPRLRISQAGSDCARRVFYQATGVASDTPITDEERATEERHHIKMALGSAFDAYALAGAPAALQEEFLLVPQKPVEITFGGLTIRGTSDALFVHASGKHVVDLKVVGMSKETDARGFAKPGTWEKAQREPKQEHAAQTNLYAYGLGADTWGVLYINANTGEMREHGPFPMDAFAARKDFGLFEEAAYWIGKGTPPPRPFEDIEEDDGTVKRARDGFPCGWCSFRGTCWPADNERTTHEQQPVQEA